MFLNIKIFQKYKINYKFKELKSKFKDKIN